MARAPLRIERSDDEMRGAPESGAPRQIMRASAMAQRVMRDAQTH